MSTSHHPSLDRLIQRLDTSTRLSDADKHAIRSLPVAVRTVEPGQALVHEGDPSSQCCIVLDGWVYCDQTLDEGRRQILSIHVPGDLPDLQGLYLSDPDFGMVALTRARVALWAHADLQALVAAFPTVSAVLWRETLVTAAIHRAWISGLGRRNALGRLAHLFCELYLRLSAVGLNDGDTLPMPLRQSDLADALGLTAVHVNRTLREMRDERLITLHGRRLEIHDWPGLCAAGEFNPRYLHLPAASPAA